MTDSQLPSRPCDPMPKIIIYKIRNVSIQTSNDNVQYCDTPDELENALKPNHLPPPTVACSSHQIGVVDRIVSNRSIDHLYIIKDTEEIMELTNIDRDKITIVKNNEELIRHLNIKIMHCFVIDASKHEQAGDIGLANQSFEEAIESLHWA